MGKITAFFIGVPLLLAIYILVYPNKKTNQPYIPQKQPQKQTATPAPSIPNSERLSNEIKLEVTEPIDGVVVKYGSITVRGKTLINADVFVNDQDLKADSEGNFSTKVMLDEGENPIVVVASDADGNYSERDFIVIYEADDSI